jgi:hypothetical protein
MAGIWPFNSEQVLSKLRLTVVEIANPRAIEQLTKQKIGYKLLQHVAVFTVFKILPVRPLGMHLDSIFQASIRLTAGRNQKPHYF